MKYKVDEKNLKLVIDLEENVPQFIKGDKLRLNQVLYNLVGNAVKFTDNGSIHVRVMNLYDGDDNVFLKFEVEDTGIGIPKDKVAAVFETFTRIRTKDRIYEGTGLGLSIAKNLVEQQGGKIAARHLMSLGHTKFACISSHYAIDDPALRFKGFQQEIAESGSSLLPHHTVQEKPTLQGGAKYDPASDSWSELPDSANAPAGRFNHTAIMAGNEMIIWAGNTAGISNDGARFNVTNQSWGSMDNNLAPEPRQFHTALWTGDRMIVWGGVDDGKALTSGGLYDPVTDSWHLIDASGVLSTGRYDHSAVWTGDRMIAWGGRHVMNQSIFAGGAMYRPQFDDWTAVTFSAGPAPRSQHVAIWNGETMNVFGGRFSSHRNIHTFHPVTDLIFSQGFESLPLR